MPHRDPRRLRTFDYLGTYRYFVTCCANRRQPLFVDADIVHDLVLQIRHSCAERRFALLAYVFMPDHLHMLLEGLAAEANFRAAMTLMRQRATIAFHQHRRAILWQHGYYERVLRSDEASESVARYIIANPVRAGLVERPDEYPYSYCWQPLEFGTPS